MLTYQMVGLADENGKTYESEYGTYSKKDRFHFSSEAMALVEREGVEKLVDVLFHKDMWKLKQDIRRMTKQDIERELGYRVQIIDTEPEKKTVDPKKHAEMDKTVDMYNRLFGTRLRSEDFF